jgi:hypothetical protein
LNRTIEDSQTLLTPEQVAHLLGVTRSWVYQHQDELPFTRLRPAGDPSHGPLGFARIFAPLLEGGRVRSTGRKPLKSRLCRCPWPDRQRDADGVTFCESCGELLPDDRDELLAAIVVKLDRLGREVEHLTRDDHRRVVA